jgi:hypothetical protein
LKLCLISRRVCGTQTNFISVELSKILNWYVIFLKAGYAHENGQRLAVRSQCQGLILPHFAADAVISIFRPQRFHTVRRYR